jgi:hypothetical protein
MRYAIIDSEGVCTNIIEADLDFADSIGAVKVDTDIYIGDIFFNGVWTKHRTIDDTSEDTSSTIQTPVTLESLQEENKLLKAQVQAQSDRSDFLEDCIAEMALEIY